jgi:hypothetical protein
MVTILIFSEADEFDFKDQSGVWRMLVAMLRASA